MKKIVSITLAITLVIVLPNCKKKEEEKPIDPDLDVVEVSDKDSSIFPLRFVHSGGEKFTVFVENSKNNGSNVSLELVDVLIGAEKRVLLRKEIVSNLLYTGGLTKFSKNIINDGFYGSYVGHSSTIVFKGKSANDFDFLDKPFPNSTVILNLAEKNDGYFFVANDRRGFSSQLIIEKTDKDFNSVWSKLFQENIDSAYTNLPSEVLNLDNNEFIIFSNIGHFVGAKSREIDFRLLKVNSSGDSIFSITFFKQQVQRNLHKAIYHNNKIIGLIRTYNNSPSLLNSILFCMDENGEVIWEKVFDEGLEINNVRPTSKGLAVVGQENGNSTNDFTARFYVSELDMNGNTLWEETNGAKGLQHLGYDIHIIGDYYYALVAQLNQSYTSTKTLVVKDKIPN